MEVFDMEIEIDKFFKDLGESCERAKPPPWSKSSPCAGQVVEILVEDGSRVKKGDVMFVLAAPSSTYISPALPFKSDHDWKPLTELRKTEIKTLLERQSGGFSVLQDNISMSWIENNQQYEDFKRFDVILGQPDPIYPPPKIVTIHTFVPSPPPIDWANKIQEEWSILEEHLPETIFVRAFKSRMDILRVAIVGHKGTPYQDGLFFFDVRIPSNYPHSPPHVRYLSGVPRINPLVDKYGEVSLFFPNAAYDSQENLWEPGTSNILQLLLSIQDLILNAEPYYNGPVCATVKDSMIGKWWSLLYNENTIVKSLKTMMDVMNKPPKIFEGLVVKHFRSRAVDIMYACRAYVGNRHMPLVSCNNHICSFKFRKDVASCTMPLYDAFTKIVDKEVERDVDSTLNACGGFVDQILCARDLRDTLHVDAAAPVYEVCSHPVDKNRKLVVGTSSAVKKKQKVLRVVIDPHGSRRNITAHMDCVVSRVLVTVGMEVEKGNPLCFLSQEEYNMSISSMMTVKESTEKNTILDILKTNRAKHAGIFFMEDLDLANSKMDTLGNGDVLKSYDNFKKFDHVVDHSDHFFSKRCSAMDQPSEDWINMIREEWRILEEQLPETIYVRAYSERMDLLRAVIIGLYGTPYSDGLFFFDVCFPSDYPDNPPLVYYHSGGLGINPNLYKCGKVQLSLPKTSGGHEMLWVPGTSTILQLLVCIQNRILNRNPLFNDHTYAMTRGSFHGDMSAGLYTHTAYIKSLMTMICIMNRPPKHFEEFVAGYFCKHASVLMDRCTRKRRITSLQEDFASCVEPLVAAFKRIGAEVPQEYLSK